MGSKSTPTSSSTVQSFNPEQILQGQYLGGLWGDARRMSGGGGETPVGQEYLDQLRSQATNNWNATSGLASSTVPSALSFANQVLGGTLPQSALPAGPQIGALNNIGNQAVASGGAYGGQIADAARGAPGAVAPDVGALRGLGNVAGATAGAAPGMVAPNVSGLNALAGQYAPLAGTGYQLGGALQNLAPAAMGAADPAMRGLYGNAGMAIGGNPIYDSLRGMASGQYIDPSTNPALAGTIRAATDPLVSQYMTATAPQTDSSFEAAGRYGSGARANAVGQNQAGLGRGLGGAISSIVNNAYNTGLSSTLGAGQALGSAYNTGTANATDALSRAGQLGQAGVGMAGNLYGQAGQTIGSLAQTGLGGAANALSAGGQLSLAGLDAALRGYGTAGNLYGTGGQLGLGGQSALTSGLTSAAGAANTGYGTGGNIMNQAGALANTGALNLGGIAQMSPDLANFPLSQATAGFNSMWAPTQNYAGILGQPLGTQPASSQTTGQAYTNVGSSIAAGLSSAASLAALFKI